MEDITMMIETRQEIYMVSVSKSSLTATVINGRQYKLDLNYEALKTCKGCAVSCNNPHYINEICTNCGH